MAISYDDANTGLFTHLGKVIKIANQFRTDQAAIEADVDEILDAFQAGDQDAAADDLIDKVAAWEAEYANRMTFLAQVATSRLLDRDSVLLEVGAKTASITDVIPKLIETMNAESTPETVDRSTATVPIAATAVTNANNNGNGSIITTKVLDGVSSPATGIAAHHEYKGQLTEVCLTETMHFRCTSDGPLGGATPGQETFEWYGDVATSTWAVADGSGSITSSLSTAVADSILTNGTFETFTTSNVPDGWTIDAGAAGTNVFEDADTADVYRGSKSLNLRGDGTTAAIQISQTIASSVTPNKRYLVAFRVKADATVSGDLTVTLAGTGYTPGTDTGDNRPSGLGLSQTDESIVIVSASLPTSWTLAWFFVNTPDEIPADLEIQVILDDTPASAKNVWIDDLVVAPVTYGGGIGVAIMPGSDDFFKEDRFTLAVQNDEAGTFQSYFRRAFGCQLPSAASAGETIADTLAE